MISWGEINQFYINNLLDILAPLQALSSEFFGAYKIVMIVVASVCEPDFEKNS